eukprot:TRINITY_DN1387_c0_g1_i1.p1 TRINITY_DN1387_c0_g1~~TRINITY_DN1387_c0_g1_i1.p1  ORF type:complete len:544 (-),score=73.38 TRINITY_DN1387_c0_g1_i1:103-1734(-)
MNTFLLAFAIFFAVAFSQPTIPGCTNLPTINGLEAINIPDFLPDPPIPPVYTDENGTNLVHFELFSYAAQNRHTGIHSENATWIFFGTVVDVYPVGCVPNVDYFWSFTRRIDENGQCIDVYTVDIERETFLASCPYTFTSSNETGNAGKICGVITVRTITLSTTTRGSGVVVQTPTEGWNNLGYCIAFGGLADSTFDVRVYAPVEIGAVIDEYYVPIGTTDKTYYITTFIQDPNQEGFGLEYIGGIVQVEDPDGVYSSYPDISNSNLLTLNYEELSLGCTTSDYVADNGDTVQLCSQRWLLTIRPDPSLCYFSLFFQIPYRVVCNNPDPLLCPLDNTNNNASIIVQIITQNLCPVVVATYSLTGRLATYTPDFSRRSSAFFTNQTVGFEFTASGVIPSNILNLRITYLSAVLGATSNADLYQPNINTIIQNGGNAAILIGANPPIPNRASDVELTYRCPDFPRTTPYATGCPPQVLRFTLYLNPAIWPIRADDFGSLKFGITVALDLRRPPAKRDLSDDEEVNEVVQAESSTVTGVNVLRVIN